MEPKKIAHLLYVPFTGLGLYGGHRGKRWLRNRIKIFKQFVIPSLMAQSKQEFILWVSWRHEDMHDPLVRELDRWLSLNFDSVDGKQRKHFFTYTGVCFWDDKYPDDVARDRLVSAIHGALGAILNNIGEADEVLMTIQPSDDVYGRYMVENVQMYLALHPDVQVYGYQKGYVMDYVNRRIAEWNPKTTPPFYTIRFPREIFADPNKHLRYTGPYKSHEYVKDYLKAFYDPEVRGFVVGTHGENISTIFNHPYTGHEFLGDNIERILDMFALAGVPKLSIRTSLRRALMKRLPAGWQRKLRYWVGQRFYAKIYDWIRS